MTKIFHPVSEQEALAELPRLRQRLTSEIGQQQRDLMFGVVIEKLRDLFR